MNSNSIEYGRLEAMVNACIAREGITTVKRIQVIIAQVRQIPICKVSDNEAKTLISTLSRRHRNRM